MAQVVEHILGKDEVGSSSLPNSSKNPDCVSGRDFYLLPKLVKNFGLIEE